MVPFFGPPYMPYISRNYKVIDLHFCRW